MTVSDQRDLVTALLAVPGVAAAAVEPVHGGPGTLRLQLAPGADEVGVAGAVNHLLRSRFGLAVDADRVRVLDQPEQPRRREDAEPDVRAEPPAATEARPVESEALPGPVPTERTEEPTAPLPRSEEPATPAPAEAVAPRPEVTLVRPARLVIQRVQLVSAGLGTSVAVSLGLDGQSFEGSAEGTATTGSLLRSVAAATLRAVESVLADDARFDVEHVEIAATGPDRTALAVVTMVTGRATQRLSGASVVREDMRQAVIRAVLAAVNRRLEPMLRARVGAAS